jgi:hypothetical protein
MMKIRTKTCILIDILKKSQATYSSLNLTERLVNLEEAAEADETGEIEERGYGKIFI